MFFDQAEKAGWDKSTYSIPRQRLNLEEQKLLDRERRIARISLHFEGMQDVSLLVTLFFKFYVITTFVPVQL